MNGNTHLSPLPIKICTQYIYKHNASSFDIQKSHPYWRHMLCRPTLDGILTEDYSQSTKQRFVAVCGTMAVCPAVNKRARLEYSPESKPAGLLFPQKKGKTAFSLVKMAVGPVVHKFSFRQKAGVEYSPDNKPAGLLFPQKKGETGQDYLKGVLDCVSKENRHKIFEFKKPAGSTLEIGPLEDTIYSEEPKVVNGWGKFYLPEIVSMQVVGVVEGTSCPWDQLVLMICEDGKLYAYDGEELHLAASSLKQLNEEGIEYPGSKTYYEGEAFKDMTKVDWEKVRKGPTGRRLEREHLKLVTKDEAKFMEYLKATAAIKECPS